METFMCKHVRCPYYIKDEGVKIRCEGIDEDSTTIHLVFPSAKARKDYQWKKCCRDYGTCLIAKMNDRKWERKG